MKISCLACLTAWASLDVLEGWLASQVPPAQRDFLPARQSCQIVMPRHVAALVVSVAEGHPSLTRKDPVLISARPGGTGKLQAFLCGFHIIPATRRRL
jgi:hypothetical protein